MNHERLGQLYQEADRLLHLVALVLPASVPAMMAPPRIAIRQEAAGRVVKALRESLGDRCVVAVSSCSDAKAVALQLLSHGVHRLPDAVLMAAADAWKLENRQ